MPLNHEQQVLISQCKELLDLLPVLQELENQLPNAFPDPTVAVNTAFVCRKAADILDEMRKKVEKVGERCEGFTCMLLQKMEESHYKTEFCTVSPNPSVYIKYPQSPKDEGFEDFVRKLPLTAMRPHYPTIKELITKAVSNCDPMPFGLKPEDTKAVELKLRITTKKEI